jgi:hypothetical protein
MPDTLARTVLFLEEVIMLASEARTATGTGTDQVVPGAQVALEPVLDVTAASAAGTDTLDVYIQAYVGGQWVDVVHFTQVLGDGGTKRFFAKISAPEPQAMFENATALAAGAVRHLVSDSYRVRWVIAGTGSFTFSVKANYVRTK